MPSSNARRAATEILRKAALASLNRDRPPPVTVTPSVISPPVLETKCSSGEPLERLANPSCLFIPAISNTTVDSVLTVAGETVPDPSDCPAVSTDVSPAADPPPRTKKTRRVHPRPWRSWLDVRHADGRPWGTPVLNSAKIGRWLLKISHELAVEAGVTVEESTTFVECNRDLIADRFANGTARSDVVKELHELLTAARMILAA